MNCTRDKVQAFVDEYVDLCRKHGFIMIGKTVDDSVVPADINTMRNIGMTKDWLDNYFNNVTSKDTVDYCTSIIEGNF